jgi:hypothetical protein
MFDKIDYVHPRFERLYHYCTSATPSYLGVVNAKTCWPLTYSKVTHKLYLGTVNKQGLQLQRNHSWRNVIFALNPLMLKQKMTPPTDTFKR